MLARVGIVMGIVCAPERVSRSIRKRNRARAAVQDCAQRGLSPAIIWDCSMCSSFRSSGLASALAEADRLRGQGELDDAERLFQSVLACEPGNAAAKIGLDRTRKARQLEVYPQE